MLMKMALTKNQNLVRVGKDVDKLGPLGVTGRDVKQCSYCGNIRVPRG